MLGIRDVFYFSILLAGILLVRKAAWGRISRMAQYCIWLFAACFLLFSPFVSIKSQYSLENIWHTYVQEFEISDEEGSPVWEDISQDIPKELNVKYWSGMVAQKNGEETDMSRGRMKDYGRENMPLEKRENSATEIMKKYAWNVIRAVAIIIFFAVLMRNFRFAVFCRKNRVFYKTLDGSGLNVYLLEGISSPFLLGRGIYVDAGIVRDKKRMKHIIMHEYCHFRHRDNFWAIVRVLCVACNWYNPLVWLANDFVKRDCELACDEAALAMLDAEERVEYGYTLLAMAKYFGGRKQNPFIASTMSGDMKRIKERILMIHSMRKQHILATGIVIACMLCLTGCAFMKEDASSAEVLDVEEPEAIYDTVGLEEDLDAAGPMEGLDALGFTEDSDIADMAGGLSGGETYVNKYCNVSAKYCGGKTYIASERGLYVIEDGSSKWDLVFRGPVTLGAITDEYLFFYSYPENIKEAAIMSLNVLTGEIETGFLLGESIYVYHEMYYENNNLYIQMPIDSGIAVFEVQQGGILWEKEEFLVEGPDSLRDIVQPIRAISPIISRSEGFSGIFYTSKEEEEEYSSKIFFCTDDSSLQKIEGVTDVMLTSKGVIGRDINQYNDIYLCDVYAGEKKQLYSGEDNSDKYFGYNTYDEQGVYGLLQEDDNSFYISRIGWDGTLEKLCLIENVDRKYGVAARMSVIGDWIYYYNPQNDKMERRSLKNKKIVETEQ